MIGSIINSGMLFTQQQKRFGVFLKAILLLKTLFEITTVWP